MRPQWHPLAERESTEARKWYAARSASTAERFVDTLEVTIELLRREPALFAVREHGLRVALIDGFPYRVIYREKAGSVQILAVAHAKRKPGYWRRRVAGNMQELS